MYRNNTILVTICARGGSKGIKNKNIVELNGKPLIEYTLNYAKKFDFIDYIIVSTDSMKIKEICEKNGMEVPFLRDEKLSGDYVHKIDVIKDALIKAEQITGKTFDIIIDLSVTSPIRRYDDMIKGLDTLLNEERDIVFSVVKSKRNPYFAQIEIKEGKVKKVKDAGNIPSRQLLPTVYDLNGSIYMWKRESLLRSESIMDGNVGIFEMEEKSWYDIDTLLDLKVVEYLIKEDEDVIT